MEQEPVQSKNTLFRRWWFWLIVVLIGLGAVGGLAAFSAPKANNAHSSNGGDTNSSSNSGISSNPSSSPAETTVKNTCTTKAGPDPATGGITWTLPDCASPLRISFPYSMDEVFANNKTGVTGYGVHAGGHIEGLNHEWIHVKEGTPIRSWADGTVVKIDHVGMGADGELSILIDYGQGLLGAHTEVKQALVKEGDTVKAGQPIAVGFIYDNATSAEYFLFDKNRDDGTFDFGMKSTVSPYDYLKEPDKSNLVAAYKRHNLDPLAAGQKEMYDMFYPYQPYLTNQLYAHAGNPGKLSGEWYSTDQNKDGDWQDCLTFIEADNPYYKGNIVMSLDEHQQNVFSGIQGKFDVDYTNGRIKIYNDALADRIDGSSNRPTLYGIFKIDETGSRPTLKFEYQEGSYPTNFSAKAKNYVLRDDGKIKAGIK